SSRRDLPCHSCCHPVGICLAILVVNPVGICGCFCPASCVCHPVGTVVAFPCTFCCHPVGICFCRFLPGHNSPGAPSIAAVCDGWDRKNSIGLSASLLKRSGIAAVDGSMAGQSIET